MAKTIIISLGGSLIVPQEIDVNWLRSFKELIEKKAKQGFKFVIICGGGKVCRNYQNASKEIGNNNKEELDWIGIKVTQVNAQLVKSMFPNSHKEIITNPTKKINFKEKIIIAAGWKPGCSTDNDAVLLARNLKVKNLINLSNIDYIYDKDPKKFNDAKVIKEISWKDFRKIVGNKWDPGLNAPFDPIASKEAEKLGMEVAIMNGKSLVNLENYIDGKQAIGSIIK